MGATHLGRVPGICLWGVVLLLAWSSSDWYSAEASGVVDGVVYIDGGKVIGTTDDDYVCATLDWWPPEKCDYGTCSWGLASLLNLDLSSPVLLNAVKAFSPLKIRLGGTLQDKVIYDVGNPRPRCTPFALDPSQLFGFTSGCLPMPRWDELNRFFNNSGAEVIFGLNALNGRLRQTDGSMGGAWDYTNAAALIRYTVEKGYNIHGWELGNELSGNGIGASVGVAQYAADIVNLKRLVDTIYSGGGTALQKPLVLAPGGFFDAAWFSELINKTKPGSLDIITHHIYNLGPGVDDHLVEKILNPSYLDGEASTFSNLQGILRRAGTSTKAWVGESGGAYNSGRNLVSNAFVFSFWYLDQLGMAAAYDTRTYCRQSLIGGNYGLLNTTTYKPNPDYYSALLWHKLMGPRALSANFTSSKYLRTFAHCAKRSQGITLLLINLDGNTTARITPVLTCSGGCRSPRRSTVYHDQGWDVREEYHLTPQNGDLHSQTVLLNGRALDVGPDGHVPPIDAITRNTAEPVVIDPYSIVFIYFPHLDAPACR